MGPVHETGKINALAVVNCRIVAVKRGQRERYRYIGLY